MLCRPSAGTCDEPEACDGRTAACPSDLFKPQGLACEAARSTCEKDAVCSGESGVCPDHRVVPNGTACETDSICITGAATCLAGACSGGTRLVEFDAAEAKVAMRWKDDGPFAFENATVAVRHAEGGTPIELAGASVSPPGSFKIVAQPTWPVTLASGEIASLVLGLDETRVGSYRGTLTIHATGCAETDLQLPIDGVVEARVSKLPGCGSPAGAASLAPVIALALLRRRAQGRPDLPG